MCKHLLEYVPKQGSAKNLLDSVCKACLSTSNNPQKAPPNCHTKKYKYICDQTKMNNILCKCQEHKPIQQYLHSNYDPELGKRNLVLYKQSTKQNRVPRVQSNSLTCKITIYPNK